MLRLISHWLWECHPTNRHRGWEINQFARKHFNPPDFALCTSAFELMIPPHDRNDPQRSGHHPRRHRRLDDEQTAFADEPVVFQIAAWRRRRLLWSTADV